MAEVVMPDEVFRVSGNIVDALNSVIYAGTLVIKNGKITAIEREFVTYMSLLAVPQLKLSNLGLIDTAKMEFLSFFEEQEMAAR